MECLSHCIVAAACIILPVGGLAFVQRVGKVPSTALGVPKTYWYGAITVGMLLMAAHSIINLLQTIARGQATASQSGAEDEAMNLELEPGE